MKGTVEGSENSFRVSRNISESDNVKRVDTVTNLIGMKSLHPSMPKVIHTYMYIYVYMKKKLEERSLNVR